MDPQEQGAAAAQATDCQCNFLVRRIIELPPGSHRPGSGGDRFRPLYLANPEPGEFGIVPYIVALLPFSLFFAAVVLLDGGIELAAGYHAVNNLFIGLVANTEVTAISSPSLFVLSIESYALFPNVFLALGLAPGLLILNFRYRWVRLPGMGR